MVFPMSPLKEMLEGLDGKQNWILWKRFPLF